MSEGHEYSVRLYDISGRTLLEEVNGTRLLVSNIPAGQYFIEVKTLKTNQWVIEKIVITNAQ